MQFRHQFPMLRLLFPYITGILTAIYLEATQVLWFAFGLLFTLIPYLLISRRKPNYRSRWIFGLVIHLILFTFGYNLVVLKSGISTKSHFSCIKCPEILAVITDPPREKEHSWKTVMRVLAVKKGNAFIPASGNLLAYLAKDSSVRLPEYGSKILICALPADVPPPANPGIFDYRKYLARNSIYQQVYLRKESWKIISNPDGFSIKGFAFQLRQKFLEMLQKNNLNGKEYAVAAALILGQDEVLDYETRHEYSGAGVMHILGISGLHVGIIYMVLTFFLGFLDRTRTGRIFKLLLVISLIWFYALITGLSPAALRAATMFTFVSAGNVLKRDIHIINSLAVSAFALLLFDPMLIMNIGFQFSYIAVCGIVLLHPGLYEMWEPRNRIADHAWNLIAMSLVAQLVTFPISLYNFHQFPVYFLPANLIAIPISTLVIYTGMAVLATSFVPPLSEICGWVTSWLLKILNAGTAWIESLPGSVISDISLNSGEEFLLYGAILSGLLFLFYRRKILLYASFLSLIVLFSDRAWCSYHQHCQEKFIVYSLSKSSAMAYIHGTDMLFFADSLLLTDRKSQDYSISGSRAFFGVEKSVAMQLFSSIKKGKKMENVRLPVWYAGRFMQVGRTRIAVISSLPQIRTNHPPLSVDYLIVRGNPSFSLTKLRYYYSAGTLVFDGSNSYSKCNRWMQECLKIKQKAWNTRESGAMIVDL